jgi:solute carrier family 25 ornithine transporter 2/15
MEIVLPQMAPTENASQPPPRTRDVEEIFDAPPKPAVRLSETVSGMVGAVACVYAGLPFDIVKARLQTGRGLLVGECVRTIFRGSGVRGFYTGALPALASQVTENAALFTANGFAVRTICNLQDCTEEQLAQKPAWFYACGAFAGVFSSTAICGFETVKVRLQIQRAQSGGAQLYSGPLDCMAKTLKSEGLRGLFRGLTALWARDIPFNAFFLGGFELASGAIGKLSETNRDELNPLQIFFAGAFAGATSWAIIFPADVVKTHMQSQSGKRSSLIQTARELYRADGIRAFYRGWSAAVCRAMPSNAALFVTYEYCSRILSGASL